MLEVFQTAPAADPSSLVVGDAFYFVDTAGFASPNVFVVVDMSACGLPIPPGMVYAHDLQTGKVVFFYSNGGQSVRKILTALKVSL